MTDSDPREEKRGKRLLDGRALWFPIVTVVGALLAGALMLIGAAPAPAIDRVVVIHFDTTRYEDFGCNGGIARTPNVDAVARRGMRYTNSIVTSPRTSPSIATFMTGRVPHQHGVYDVGGVLDEQFATLAELLKARGFVTGGFTSNPLVGQVSADGPRSPGYDQGFDVFETVNDAPPIPEGVEGNSVPRGHAALMVDRAIEFVDEHEDEPFFLWMLHLDPHTPYAPPAPFDELYLDDVQLRAGSARLNPALIHHQAYVSGRLDSHEYVARHLGEVTMVDDHLGRLLARLDELPGRTLLVVTSDHGESLGDANIWFDHGQNIRWPCVNVPLIVACDGVVPTGVSDALVANIDLAPTILDLLGVDLEELNGNGRSLVPTFRDDDPWPDRLIPIQCGLGIEWRGVRSPRFSLQSLLERPDRKSYLYDLAADPKETVDVSAEYPDVFEELLAFEQDWFGRPGFLGQDIRGDPEMMRQLRALGYVQ